MDLAKAIVAAGHDLGNHSFSHKRMIFKSPAFVKYEVDETDKAIRQAGYDGPIYFRAPYAKKLFILPWYLRQSKHLSVTFDVEPESFEATADGIIKHVNDKVKNGSIILLHGMYDANQEARAALPIIIDNLSAAGFDFVTLSELLEEH